MPQSYRRVAIISDLHCGHAAGLTPTEFECQNTSQDQKLLKLSDIRKQCWAKYLDIIKQLGKVDLLIVGGDAIDGRGERSGSVELLYVDRREQVKMATACLKAWNARNYCMVRGTPYHTGDKENWEDDIANALGCHIGEHEWAELEGYIFDIKHKVGSSQIPHGRYTAAAKEDLWNQLWAASSQQPNADMIVRSHVHYYCGGFNYTTGKKRRFLTTPALQSMGTRYGARECSGKIDWGVLAFDISKGKIIQEHEHIVIFDGTRAKTTKY